MSRCLEARSLEDYRKVEEDLFGFEMEALDLIDLNKDMLELVRKTFRNLEVKLSKGVITAYGSDEIPEFSLRYQTSNKGEMFFELMVPTSVISARGRIYINNKIKETIKIPESGRLADVVKQAKKGYLKNRKKRVASELMLVSKILTGGRWAEKTKYRGIDMELVGTWLDLSAYYKGSDGNYWSYQSGRWSNQGESLGNVRGKTLSGKPLDTLPDL